MGSVFHGINIVPILLRKTKRADFAIVATKAESDSLNRRPSIAAMTRIARNQRVRLLFAEVMINPNDIELFVKRKEFKELRYESYSVHFA